MFTLSSAGLFLSGFFAGFLSFWLRWYFRPSWAAAFRRRKYSMRNRRDYLIRLSGRAQRHIRRFGRHYGHSSRFDSPRF